MIDFQVAFRWAWKCPRQLLLQKIYDSMIFRFSGLWQIKILKGSDIGPVIKSEAELGAGTLVRPSLQRPRVFQIATATHIGVLEERMRESLLTLFAVLNPAVHNVVCIQLRDDTRIVIFGFQVGPEQISLWKAWFSKTFRSISGRPEKPRSEFVL